MIMLKDFLPLFLLTKSLYYYFHFTWYQYSTGLFPENIAFLLTVILATCPFFLTSMFRDWGMIWFFFYVFVSDFTLNVFDS